MYGTALKQIFTQFSYFIFIDILCCIKAIPKELHPSIHRHQKLVPIPALEPFAANLRVHSNQSVLRLSCYGYNLTELRISCHERGHRRGRVLLLGDLLHRDVYKNYCQRFRHQQIHLLEKPLELAGFCCHNQRIRHYEHG